ncbi:MAG TPA: aldo/keto reductase, partial [Polyangiaceae bacterium]|nr:aldo/keto reductase [Polyangiaceae bacterium]
MEARLFGSTGARVPVIGLGTWQMENDDRKSAVAALRAGLDLGMTHVDTAELYGSGRVEELVGEAIEGRRDELFLVSKIMPDHATRRGTITSCEKTLKRLRTDRLDCYLIHWPGPHPLEDSIAGFEELRQNGKIRSWGVSNFDERLLERVLEIAGPGKLACNQVLYHLQERSIEHAVLPWCEKHAVAVVGYTPFGRATFPPRNQAGKTLERIASKHGATPRQVALAFLTRQTSLFAIPKSSDPEHVRENARGGAVSLDQHDIGAIESEFAAGGRRKGVPML